MHHDITLEDLLALADVPNELPERRGGRKPHISCVYRWSTTGCKGIRLETIQIGGTRCTSRQALSRFFKALSEISGLAPKEPSGKTPAARARSIASAEQELAAAGI